MRPNVLILLVLVALLLGTAACGLAPAQAAAFPGGETTRRSSEPVDVVIADLEDYIPVRMAEDGVAGLSIALIRDGQIAWTEGFGVSNRFSGKPVTPETVFEVGSISKALTAYTALRLVEDGSLDLDTPLVAYLSEPWLPPSEYSDPITLRHLASHSSGLGDNSDSLIGLDKSVAFKPGSSFYYSGTGFMYMQAAIEQVSGRSLEETAREAAFGPLGMASSSFLNSPTVRPHLASGYLDFSLALILFLMPFVPLFIIAVLLTVLAVRVLKGRWRLTWQMWLAAAAVAGILSLGLLTLQWGAPLPNLVLLMGLGAVAFALAFVALFFVGSQGIARLSTGWPRRVLLALWAVASLLVLLILAGRITVGVPRVLSPQPSSVGTLRASAPDLAAFLIELADSEYLSDDLAAQIHSPQISAGRDMSWGLGLGIARGAEGDALWQNGQTFGFRSLVVIYPEQGWGVVVLTNSAQGFPVAFDVAERALGGSAVPTMRAWLGF
jgi:CubicO group peptidase (beta-lactamase class C family)